MRMNVRATNGNSSSIRSRVQACHYNQRSGKAHASIRKPSSSSHALKKQKQISAWGLLWKLAWPTGVYPLKQIRIRIQNCSGISTKFFFGWAAESFASVERTYETVGRMCVLAPKADID
jgi:hypothetical protein